jgi:hypothetical protein
MAQDVGSVFGGPLAALLHESTGSWIPVFQLVIAMDLLTAVLCRAQADAAPLYRRPRISHGAAPAIRIGLRCARRCLGRKRKLYRADETIAAFARQGSSREQGGVARDPMIRSSPCPCRGQYRAGAVAQRRWRRPLHPPYCGVHLQGRAVPPRQAYAAAGIAGLRAVLRLTASAEANFPPARHCGRVCKPVPCPRRPDSHEA